MKVPHLVATLGRQPENLGCCVLLTAHSEEHEDGFAALAGVALVLAGRINRQQQDVIEYLMTENRVLGEESARNGFCWMTTQRRQLDVKAKTLGRKMLEKIATIVTPDTILRWHRELVALRSRRLESELIVEH